MKAGYINLLSSASTSGGVHSSYAIDNDSLKMAEIPAGGSIVLSFTPALLEFIALINYEGTCVVITLTGEDIDYNLSENGYMFDDFIYDMDIAFTGVSPITYFESKTLYSADATGFDTDNFYLTGLPEVLYSSIEITNFGSSTAYLGYIWAGAWINFDCLENMQMFDNSNDSVTINRANRPLTEESYLFQSLMVTTKKGMALADLRDNIRLILTTGYANPRPWLIEDGIYAVPELLYGVLTSGKVGYDYFQTVSETLAQSTFEIREVS